MGRWEDCESVFTHLETKKMKTEEYLVRRPLSIQRALERGDMENAYWLPGTENPADGLTSVCSDMVPLLRLLGSGRFNPGSWMALGGAAWDQGAARA